MKNKWKIATFVAVDVVVLCFFGFYLVLNLKYKEGRESGDFSVRVLANDSSNSSGSNSTTITCGTNEHESNGSCVCDDGYVSSDGGCVCPEVDVRLESRCSGLYSSPGTPTSDGGNGKCGVEGTYDLHGGTLSKQECSASGFGSVSSGANCGTFTANSSSISGLSCSRTSTITYKVTNSCGNSKSATTSVKIMKGWSSGQKVEVNNPDNVPHPRQSAEDDSDNVAYEECTPSNGAPSVCTRYSRGCGKARLEPSCFEDENGFLWWDYDYKNSSKSLQQYNSQTGQYDAKKGYTKKPDIKKSECYTEFKCSTQYPKSASLETTCNSTGEFSTTDSKIKPYVKKCGVKKGSEIGEEFYRIECNETMKTGFNGPILNSDSYPNSFLYPGTAFKFNYVAKTKVSCEGKWHQKFYEAAKKYVTNYKHEKVKIELDKIGDNSVDDSILQKFSDSALKEGIGEIENSYKNWKLNYFRLGNKEKGVIYDQQPSVTGVKKDEYRFDGNKELGLDLMDGYKNEVDSCPPEGLVTHKNSENVNFTYQVAYTIRMQLPVLYYSGTNKNQYTTTETSGYKTLGRVFPISDIEDYANRNDYKYVVTISNLGLAHKWTNTETCGLTVKDKEIVFRAINLSDPFIQQLDSNHKIGENWKNSKFDFTNIIDKNTWSNASQFNEVRIDQTVGKLIKEELSKQYNSYLGSCATGTDKGTTPQICALYKQAIAGKG